MKASISLLSRLARCRIFIRTSVSGSCSPSSSILSPGSSTHGSIIQTNRFLSIPSRNFATAIDDPANSTSGERKIEQRYHLERAFESAETIEKMLKVFEAMEASFDEKDLGMDLLKIGFKLDREGEDPEKALSFANRALKALEKCNERPSFSIAMALQLLGSVNCSLKRFSDSLGYLNRANRLLVRLEEEGVSVEDVRPVLHAVQLELASVKTAMGRREEALENLKKCLEIKEMVLEKDCRELGVAYRGMAEGYIAALDFKEALPYVLKALEIHEKELGKNSVEVARDRRLLGVVYTGLEEHEKALEQNVLSQKVLKKWGLRSELLRAEIDSANIQITLGKFEEALNTLKGVVNQTGQDSQNQALVFISMAKAFFHQENFSESRNHLRIACEILKMKEMNSPVEVAEAYSEISMQYENMEEYETAISLLERALGLLEREPQEQHSEGSISARIGWLLLLTGRVQQAVPYLESAAEILKESFGPKHYGVGYVYNNLGAAYLEQGRPHSGAQAFALAKDIMDALLGPNHKDSINSCQNLSKAYSAMGSYALAVEFQQRAIDAWESHGPSADNELGEAKRLLEELEKKACKDLEEKGFKESHEPSEEDELREAERFFDVLEKKAYQELGEKGCGASANEVPMEASSSSTSSPENVVDQNQPTTDDEIREAERLLGELEKVYQDLEEAGSGESEK